jgi:hypothetical protein
LPRVRRTRQAPKRENVPSAAGPRLSIVGGANRQQNGIRDDHSLKDFVVEINDANRNALKFGENRRESHAIPADVLC